MNVILRLFAVAASAVVSAAVALPAAAAESGAQSASTAVLKKPERAQAQPGFVSAMRAKKNADGTLTYECVEVARPARRMADRGAPEETRQER